MSNGLNYGQMRALVAQYLNQPVSSFSVTSTDTVAENPVAIDLLDMAINDARRSVERVHDFKYSETNASITIGSAGPPIVNSSLITSATVSGGGAIKRVRKVALPIAGGVLPIEFLTDDEWQARVKRQAGRIDYNPVLTPAQCGFFASNPTAVQQGQTLFLYPASQFTFPLAGVSLDVVAFLPDYIYSALSYTDFFLMFAPDYIFWQSVISANKLCFRFVPRKEGNTGEPEEAAQAALASLIEWDDSLSASTSSPVKSQSSSVQQKQNQ
jgi:hypothetical protein